MREKKYYIFIFLFFIFQITQGQKIELKLYNNIDEYAEEVNLPTNYKNNIKKYCSRAPYIKWVNNEGFNPKINKIIFCLADGTDIYIYRIVFWQNEFEYLMPENFKEKAKSHKILGLILVLDDHNYDHEINDGSIFINYFSYE